MFDLYVYKLLRLTRSWKLQILHLVVAQSSWEIIPLSTQIQVSKKYHGIYIHVVIID